MANLRAAGGPGDIALKKQVDELDNRLQGKLAELFQELADLKKRLPAAGLPTTTLYPPPNPSPNSGTIRLYNTSNHMVSVIIDNGRANRLESGETMSLPRAAGTFTYEVLGMDTPQTRQTRELRPGEEYRIEIYDKAIGPTRTR